MYEERTVFITGAGASCHYGYPTGEKLITEVKEIAGQLMRLFDRCKIVGCQPRIFQTGDGVCYDLRIQECKDLVDRLKSGNPVVIDYFLGQNPDLQEIGNFCIAYAILKCESELLNRFQQVTSGGEDDWLRFVIEEIAQGCAQSGDIYKNNANFVTFNYDRSLEWRIYKGLRARRIFEETDIKSFIAKDLILHVYGSVKFDHSIDNILPNSAEIETWLQAFHDPSLFINDSDVIDPCINDSDVVRFLDVIYESAQNIRVIEPQHKNEEEECILKAIETIRNAKNIYILGYGFDSSNCDRLKLKELIGGSKSHKHIFYTNFGNQQKILMRFLRYILGNDALPASGLISGKFTVALSAGTVYQALASDFI